MIRFGDYRWLGNKNLRYLCAKKIRNRKVGNRISQKKCTFAKNKKFKIIHETITYRTHWYSG
jgi:hypothetical protein